MRRNILIASGVLAALVVLGLVGGYVYYFTGIRTAPKPLALSTPSPAAPAATLPSPSGLAGSWTVSSGSIARYRVNEKFAGQTSNHEAVAETSTVSGTLAVGGSPGALQATAASVVVDLASLHSVDQVLGYNVSNRDRIVSQSLSVQQFPQATFKADPFAIPAGLESGQTVTVSVPGQMTIHGVTRAVTATIKVQPNGTSFQAVGTIPTAMTDFGVSPPQVGITVVQPQVTIEFLLNLARSA
ncbi:MAG: YceI family protein [Candidatus Dormibacteraeota bacterium]|nr:YceI family protein [Candidatus Dormibacteraeota bacterium]